MLDANGVLQLAVEARRIRNEYLKETDHWGLADYPATTEQLNYRIALRDLPTDPTFPELNGGLNWPTKPE